MRAKGVGCRPWVSTAALGHKRWPDRLWQEKNDLAAAIPLYQGAAANVLKK